MGNFKPHEVAYTSWAFVILDMMDVFHSSGKGSSVAVYERFQDAGACQYSTKSGSEGCELSWGSATKSIIKFRFGTEKVASEGWMKEFDFANRKKQECWKTNVEKRILQ